MRKSERSCDTHTSSPTSIVACLVLQNQSFISFFIHKITRTRENFFSALVKRKKIRLQLIICTLFACITSSPTRRREKKLKNNEIARVHWRRISSFAIMHAWLCWKVEIIKLSLIVLTHYYSELLRKSSLLIWFIITMFRHFHYKNNHFINNYRSSHNWCSISCMRYVCWDWKMYCYAIFIRS